MPTPSPTLLVLRICAHLVAATLGLPGVQVAAHHDNTHFSGPRYYCLYRLPGPGSEWQEASEAETPAGALDNLRGALVAATQPARNLSA